MDANLLRRSIGLGVKFAGHPKPVNCILKLSYRKDVQPKITIILLLRRRLLLLLLPLLLLLLLLMLLLCYYYCCYDDDDGAPDY